MQLTTHEDSGRIEKLAAYFITLAVALLVFAYVRHSNEPELRVAVTSAAAALIATGSTLLVGRPSLTQKMSGPDDAKLTSQQTTSTSVTTPDQPPS